MNKVLTDIYFNHLAVNLLNTSLIYELSSWLNLNAFTFADLSEETVVEHDGTSA